MTMNSFDKKLIELERQVFAASAADRPLVMQRLRRLVKAIESRPAPSTPVYEDDDMRFDNVPV